MQRSSKVYAWALALLFAGWPAQAAAKRPEASTSARTQEATQQPTTPATWERREQRRTAGVIAGAAGLGAGAVTTIGALAAAGVHCREGLCDRRSPIVGLAVGTGLTLAGATVLTTMAGLRATGRLDRRAWQRDPKWATRDDVWSRRMAGFGVVAGLGVAAFASFAVVTPLAICHDDQCTSGDGVVTGTWVGAPLIAVGLAGLAVTGSHRHHHRRERPGATVKFTGTGLTGAF